MDLSPFRVVQDWLEGSLEESVAEPEVIRGRRGLGSAPPKQMPKLYRKLVSNSRPAVQHSSDSEPEEQSRTRIVVGKKRGLPFVSNKRKR